LEQLTNLLAERDCQFYGIFLRVNYGASANTTICPMIRYADIEDDTYEPYTEQTLTLQTPNGLPGIPLGTIIPDVIKNSPIHMSGVYWDDNEGQYYIADTKNENGKNVQRIGKSIVDLSKYNVVIGDITDDGNCKFFWVVASFISDHLLTRALSNKFVYSYNGAYPSFWFADVRIIFENKISEGVYKFADVESFKNEVGEVEFYYILATPIETPLTDEEIIAYKTLHSNKPTTIITNDAGCFMEVEYVADTKNHIAQNYVPVTAFNNVLDRISALEQLHV
jgi:hypothetical protein